MSIHNARVGDAIPPKKAFKKPFVSAATKPTTSESIKVKMKVPVADGTIPSFKPEQVDKLKKKKIHNLDGKFIHIRVGDPSWNDMNMLQTEMDKVEAKVKDLFEENEIDCTVFVTHWAVDMKLIESQERKKGTHKAL